VQGSRSCAAGRAGESPAGQRRQPRFWKCRVLWLDNLGRRLKGDSFRSFAHPPQEMVAVLEEAGPRASYRWRGFGWCVVGFER